MTHSGRRSADESLAAELAAGKTIREAAITAGVSERTAFRRLEDAAFKARIAELRSEMVRTAAGRLVEGMTEAASVLRAGLTDADANVRHKSAVKLIELGVKVTELAELERRVEELERYLSEGSKP
ncbi:hypothetical protein [Frigoriglobus tundricola]|uniref:Uncharacterized protein n=1 Tax=Frigoriglobus tundricola TaxID=2774151 RepID=A0A6M5YT71_9BACT|nr:hypothetical protein [Frigoriglobus tundricola]QJW97265.1 hypothetical protein FTUN_4835 [Frigoriglobus tundricola]